jgi:hypothetical protein
MITEIDNANAFAEQVIVQRAASGFRTLLLKTCSGKLGITNYRWNFKAYILPAAIR